VLPPFITPIGSFYAFANGPWPAAMGTEASLEIAGGGLARSVRWSDASALPQTPVIRTLECDGNGYISAQEGLGCQMGGESAVDPEMNSEHPPALHWTWRFGGIGNAEWATVSLAELFAGLGIPTSGDWLHAAGRDGYRRSFPAAVALHPNFRVALGMNGQPLPHAHGAPARLLVPGQYGAMNVKWVQSLRFGPRDEPAEAAGGAQTAYETKPLAFATLPEDRSTVASGSVEIGGIAFAGGAAVKEVALWMGDLAWTAELVDDPQPHIWTRWRSRVDLPPGDHEVRIACIAADGRQSVPQPAYGEAVGYGGLHILRVSAT
jgi:DMSO/TMAO reductase YedYZ molybdopterin-dependent catalytic subunit